MSAGAGGGGLTTTTSGLTATTGGLTATTSASPVILTTVSTPPAVFSYDCVRRELANQTELISRSSLESHLAASTRNSLESHLVSRSSLDSQDSLTHSLSSPLHQDDQAMEEDFRYIIKFC